MRLQDHCKTLIMLRWLKVRNEGPIVLMMLVQKKRALNPPYRGGKLQKRVQKSSSFLTPTRASKGGVGGSGGTPYKHSLARRASALDHDGQAGFARCAASAESSKLGS